MVFYMPTAFGYLVYFRSSIYLSKKDNFPILKAEKIPILYIIFFTFSYNKKKYIIQYNESLCNDDYFNIFVVNIEALISLIEQF